MAAVCSSLVTDVNMGSTIKCLRDCEQGWEEPRGNPPEHLPAARPQPAQHSPAQPVAVAARESLQHSAGCECSNT